MNDTNKFEESVEQFSKLSTSRKNTLAREAAKFIRENPGSADNSRFWRCLSARQVREMAHSARQVREMAH